MILQHENELAMERVHLGAVHELFINDKVEAHLPIDRVRNQAEQPEAEGMHVEAQVFQPKRGGVVADYNITEIRESESVPTAVELQCIAQPHDRLDLSAR